MATFGENLARLRVAAATGTIPLEVAQWAAEELAELEPVGERLEGRNALLREAVAGLSGSTWSKACRLQEEVRAARSCRRGLPAAADPVRLAVVRALELDPGTPDSVRQLLRILAS